MSVVMQPTAALVTGMFVVFGRAAPVAGSQDASDVTLDSPGLPQEIMLMRSATPLHALAAGWCGLACTSLEASPAMSVEHIENYRNVQYYGPITFGTPGVVLNTVFDTGSSDAWFPRKKLASGSEPISSSMDCSSSSKVRIQYSIGEVSGGICKDRFAIAQSIVQSMPFIAADHTADLEQMHFDGVFGLAFPSLSHMRPGDSPLEQLEKKLDMRSFAFVLGDESMVGSSSKLVIGSPSDAWFQGDNITYVPVAFRQWWTYYGAIIVGSIILLQDSLFALDTGTSYLTMPETVAAALVRAMMPDNGSRCIVVQEGASKMWACPCEDSHAAQVVYIHFNKVMFPIYPEDLIEKNGPWRTCFVQIQAPIGAEGMPIIIGDTFLRTVGSVYDVQHSRIGLAANPSYRPKLAESERRFEEDKTKSLSGPLLPPHRPFDYQNSTTILLLCAIFVGSMTGFVLIMCLEYACTRPCVWRLSDFVRRIWQPPVQARHCEARHCDVYLRI